VVVSKTTASSATTSLALPQGRRVFNTAITDDCDLLYNASRNKAYDTPALAGKKEGIFACCLSINQVLFSSYAFLQYCPRNFFFCCQRFSTCRSNNQRGSCRQVSSSSYFHGKGSFYH
jgi:hypothetical protein